MIGKTMKDIFERNEGKHARQMDTDSGIVNEVRKKILEYKKSPTKEEISRSRSFLAALIPCKPEIT